MANNIILVDGNYYLKSDCITVFPCAYRGQGKDVKSKLTTEENFVKAVNGFGRGAAGVKDSYVVSEITSSGNTAYVCSIHGYRFTFTLTADDITKIIDGSQTKYKYAYIVISPKTAAVTTDFLASQHSTEGSQDTTLDFSHTPEGGTEVSLFSGLTFKSSPEGPYYVDLLAADRKRILSTSAINSRDTDYSIPNNFRNDNSNNNGTVQIPTTDSNATNSATGKDAIALGYGTTADKDYLVAIGEKNATPEAGDLFVVGNGSYEHDQKSTVLQVNRTKVKINAPTTITGKVTVTGDLGASGSVTIEEGLDAADIVAQSLTVEGEADAQKALITNDQTASGYTVEAKELVSKEYCDKNYKLYLHTIKIFGADESVPSIQMRFKFISTQQTPLQSILDLKKAICDRIIACDILTDASNWLENVQYSISINGTSPTSLATQFKIWVLTNDTTPVIVRYQGAFINYRDFVDTVDALL